MNKRQKDPSLNLSPCYSTEKLPPIVDFEAIFLPDGFEKVTEIVPALAFNDVRGVQVLGENLLNTMDIFRARSGEAMQGAIFLDSFFKNRKDPVVSQFVQRFYSTYGSEPGILEVQAYDTTSIVLDVIARNHPTSRKVFCRGLAKRPRISSGFG